MPDKDPKRNYKDSGERELLRGIRARASRTGNSAIRVGIGDDCAVLRPRAGEEIVVTTDFSLEGRHFRLDWHEPEAIGHKCLARGLSDIAAMGARPLAVFVSLALPRALTGPLRPGVSRRSPLSSTVTGDKSVRGSARSHAWIDRFYTGLLALADREHITLAGGDLSESPILAVADIVVVGRVPRGRALLRSTARAGDIVYVTGTLGGAAAELAMLQASHTGNGKPAKITPEHRAGDARLDGEFHPHFYPVPRLAAGQALLRRKLASACIDISDGLSTDLLHLCEESDLSAELEAASIPLGRGAKLEHALHGGDDYELLFTASPQTRMPKQLAGVAIHALGRLLTRKPGAPRVALVTHSGRRTSRVPVPPLGWEHF